MEQIDPRHRIDWRVDAGTVKMPYQQSFALIARLLSASCVKNVFTLTKSGAKQVPSNCNILVLVAVPHSPLVPRTKNVDFNPTFFES
jgi:hypothetical protein